MFLKIITTLVMPLFAVNAFAAVENLDEVIARKPRLPSATWGRTLLEGTAPAYYWQTETLQYNDVTTGNEVWRFTSVPSGKNFTQDISTSHWSANGNRVSFASNRQNVYKPSAASTNYTWFIANSDGSKMRAAYGASCADWNWSYYPAWNPSLSDVLYLPGDGTTGKNLYTLYKNTVSDASVTYSPVVNLDNSVTRRMLLKKGMAGDGSKLLFRDINNSSVFVVNLLTSSLETPNTGYSASLNWDTYWGDTVSPNPTWHDNYVSGATGAVNGILNYHMGSGTHTWWRSTLTGTGADNAPTHVDDNTAPYTWGGELEPVNAAYSGNDPFGGVEHASHFTMDRWGKYGIHSKSSTSPYGTSLLDVGTHFYWNSAKAFSGAGVPWVQHHDWEAWSDWSASSGGTTLVLDYSTYRLLTQNYLDPTSQKVVALTHTRINGIPATPVYESVARPTQSPDGTKIMFDSTFLNTSDDDVQILWAVAYYPYPPEIKSATKNGSNVRLTWDFNQGASCASQSTSAMRTGPTPNLATPRTYATRGWPHETLDCPPSPREIKQFRVWVSSDNSTWSPVGTTTYNNCSGSNECGMWTETAWTFDYAQPNATTRYYAVTSLEYSGLESRKLSNAWKVVTDEAGAVTSQVEQTAYPANPGDKPVTAFYTTAPSAPESVSSTYASGYQYTVAWSRPASHSTIRHYNIYALDGSAPTATQQRRIASVPVTSDYADTGSMSYVDWAGSDTGNTQYMITAVDYWGNESAGVSAQVGTTNGICGPSNGLSLSSAPTGLCSAGTASSVTGSGPWSWSCAGSGGGSTASCGATMLETPPTGNASALVACPVIAGFR